MKGGSAVENCIPGLHWSFPPRHLSCLSVASMHAIMRWTRFGNQSVLKPAHPNKIAWETSSTPNSASCATYYATPWHSQTDTDDASGLGTYVEQCHRHSLAAAVMCQGFTSLFLYVKCVMESIEGIILRWAIYHQRTPTTSHPKFTGWQARWYSISNQHLNLLSSRLLLTNHASIWQHVKTIGPHNFNCAPGTLKWSLLLFSSLTIQYVFSSRKMDQNLIISDLWVQPQLNTPVILILKHSK